MKANYSQAIPDEHSFQQQTKKTPVANSAADTAVTSGTLTGIETNPIPEPEVDTETGNKPCDLMIIGAGIVGLCCAIRLQMEGYRVTLVDKGAPGKGCSEGNAGHFATEQVLPLATPGLLAQIPGMLTDPMGPVAIRWSYLTRITPWFIRFMLNTRQRPFRQGADAISKLNSASLPAWQKLLNHAGQSDQLKKQGSWLVFEKMTSFAGWQKNTAPLLAHYGVPTEITTGQQVREAEPALSQDLIQGVFFPETGHTTNPLRLSETLFRCFTEQGGRFIQAEVTGVFQQDQQCRIETTSGHWSVPQVLVTAGAWSRELVRQATGIKVPLDTERGYHLMIPDASALLKVPVSSADRKFIMTPMDSGMRLAGTVEFAGLNAPARMQRAHMLTGHARALLPDLPDRTGDSWMGFRPSLPDSLPVIDRTGSHGQILLAFAHQHLGLTQAAITAELIADLKQNRQPSIPLSPYRLDRF